MSLIAKINRKLNLSKTVEYDESIKGQHDIKGNLFDYINNKKAESFEVKKVNRGKKVCLTYEHDLISSIEYHFRYNRDDLLLLRGVSINKLMIIPENSIPDFAIYARPAGTDCKAEWVPAHGRIKGVSADNKMEINYDNASFKITQMFNAVNPNAPDEILWIHSVEHTITKESPYLEITNSMEFMQDTEVDRLFLTMLPVNAKNVNKLYLSNGTLFNGIPNDGTHYREEDEFSSAMYTGEYKSGLNYAAAVETNRVGNHRAVVAFRKDDISKFYINESPGIARKNEVINNTQRIVCLTADSEHVIKG